jgi:Uma2 family endonuclease
MLMATATKTETTLESLETLEDLLEALGGISPRRVRLRPKFGTATEKDLIAVNAAKQGIFELVDGVLVEKSMGKLESLLAAAILAILRGFIQPRNLGIITAPDGMMRLTPTISRAPDASFISWARIPPGPLSEDSLAEIVPDLAVEVLSPSNTKAEMARKRREYFGAGVRLVWEVDPRARTVTVYESPDQWTILDASMSLDGGAVLPGFVLPLSELFGELDRDRDR